MKTKLLISLAFILFISFTSTAQLKYPQPKKGDVKDNYFGTIVPDPYRWMEDDNAAEVKDWVQEENKVTFGYLEKIPFRSKIKDRLGKHYNCPRYSTPFKGGDKYYFYKNDGLQNQSILYQQDDLNSEPVLFLDPTKLSDDGTVSLTSTAFSKDGKYFAYGTASGGSDWNEFYVMDVTTQKVLSDHLKWIKFSGISWAGDGFFYGRMPEPSEGKELTSSNEYQKIYYHKIGTPQAEDKFIYGDDKNPKMTFFAQTTEDERFLAIYASQGTSNNALYVKDLSNEDSKILPIVTNFDNNYSVVDNDGSNLLIMTDKRAPKYKLVSVDPNHPEENNWKTILPESENVLQNVGVIGGQVLAQYMQDA